MKIMAAKFSRSAVVFWYLQSIKYLISNDDSDIELYTLCTHKMPVVEHGIEYSNLIYLNVYIRFHI